MVESGRACSSHLVVAMLDFVTDEVIFRKLMELGNTVRKQIRLKLYDVMEEVCWVTPTSTFHTYASCKLENTVTL